MQIFTIFCYSKVTTVTAIQFHHLQLLQTSQQGFRMPLSPLMRTSQADSGLQNAHSICHSDIFGRTACLRKST